MRRASPGLFSACIGNIKCNGKRFFCPEAQADVASPHGHRSALLSKYTWYTQGRLDWCPKTPNHRGGEGRGNGTGKTRQVFAGSIFCFDKEPKICVACLRRNTRLLGHQKSIRYILFAQISCLLRYVMSATCNGQGQRSGRACFDVVPLYRNSTKTKLARGRLLVRRDNRWLIAAPLTLQTDECSL